jgi:predicted ATPase
VITALGIRNFKCFLDAEFDLRPLTVLTGLNGSGKSTVIQALLLARQAAQSPSRLIQLNGPYGLALGEAHELLHPAAQQPELEVRLRTDETDADWTYRFGIPIERALHLTVETSPSQPSPALDQPGSGFTYLCAERLGPRDLLSVSAEPPDELGVGVRGEHTAQVLALRQERLTTRRLTVREPLRHPDSDVPLLRPQAEAWASHIIRPIQITAQWAPGIAASTIRFKEAGPYGAVIRPANTGFGVSYGLPIIVAGLMTEPGDILIVENPEAHLHPAGQSRLGRFLAQVASSGAQVIVETHSDHVLNGARLGVAEEGPLSSQKAIVHYFGRDEAVPIELTSRGELTTWPSGFFDQIEDDLGRLARARRRR